MENTFHFPLYCPNPLNVCSKKKTYTHCSVSSTSIEHVQVYPATPCPQGSQQLLHKDVNIPRCQTQVSPIYTKLSNTGISSSMEAVPSLGIPAAAQHRCLPINSSRLVQVKVPVDLLLPVLLHDLWKVPPSHSPSGDMLHPLPPPGLLRKHHILFYNYLDFVTL